MDLTKYFRYALRMIKSVDFWLFMASFFFLGFTLQTLGTLAAQVVILILTFLVCVSISAVTKLRSGWSRTAVGRRGALSAIGIVLFGCYVFSSLSQRFATRRGINLTGSYVEQSLTALTDPGVFGSVMPFLSLFVFSCASYLGLTDVSDQRDAT